MLATSIRQLAGGRVVDRPPATKLATKLLSGLCESPQTTKLSPRTASGTGGQATNVRKRPQAGWSLRTAS
jgi:hypothetical protein